MTIAVAKTPSCEADCSIIRLKCYGRRQGESMKVSNWTSSRRSVGEITLTYRRAALATKNQIPSSVKAASELPAAVSSLTTLGVRSLTLESATKKQIHERGTATRRASDGRETA